MVLSAIPRDFAFFEQDIGQVSRLRLKKFTCIFLKVIHFSNLTVLRKTVETGLGSVSRKSRNVFGSISGDIILFVSSKRRRLEARNFAVILIFIPFTTYEKNSSKE